MKVRLSCLTILSACCALAAFASTRSQAATYYVATNGDDNRTTAQATNSGTPWKTIQKAVDVMVAGDTTLVFSGTYQEKVVMENKVGSRLGQTGTKHN